MITEPRLASIQVGQPRHMTDPGWPDLRTGPWVSAIIKERVEGPAWLSTTNLAGDKQGNPAPTAARTKPSSATAPATTRSGAPSSASICRTAPSART